MTLQQAWVLHFSGPGGGGRYMREHGIEKGNLGVERVGLILRTLALKTDNFYQRSLVAVQRKRGFTKTLLSFLGGLFCARDGFSKAAGRAEGDFLLSGQGS